MRARIYNASAPLDESRLYSMLRASQSGELLPTAAQAAGLFDNVAARRFAEVDSNDLGAVMSAGLRGYNADQETKITGLILSTSLAPALAKSDLPSARLEAIERFVTETGSLVAIGAIIPFLGVLPEARKLLLDAG